MVQNSLKVSVVIPAYNEEKYIGKCLESLIAQSEPANEIIVVNNKSTDNTKKIVKNFPVILINESQQGITFSRNKGFNFAKYDIISRTDADTILPKDWIKNIKKHFLKEKLVAVSGPSKFYDLPLLIQNNRVKSKPTLLRWIRSYNIIINKILKHDCLYGPNYSIRKSAWDKIKNKVCLDNREVHEDLDLAIHIAPLGKILFDNSLVVSTSARRWKKPEAYFEYLYRALKSIKKHNTSFILRKRLKSLISSKIIKSLN